VTPAITFEPDGYLPKDGWLMGRQSAGAGFLRAAVAGRGDGPVVAFTPWQGSAGIFRRTVQAIDPDAPTEWIPGQRLDLLAARGLLYRPDQVLGPSARQRLRLGPAAYSLCGVTHTLATSFTLDAIAKIVVEPLMPWDALICTSRAALAAVTVVLDHAEDHLRWRAKEAQVPPRLMLPVIPLGVHTADFSFSDEDRAAARSRLKLAADEVAVLSAGRLSLNGKAHPYAIFKALQSVAVETGRPLALVLAGQAFNKTIVETFETAAAAICPDVRTVFVDGKAAEDYRAAWAGADIFISLADSIQETFGLTPLEAMASGLPALVSDWDGYRDTVRDGLDGFRIPTWAPAPGGGQVIAHDYEIGLSRYEEYLYQSNAAVALDQRQLHERLRDLVLDEGLRRRLGAAGQAHARDTFDWSVVYAGYQALWAEQAALRDRAATDPGARARLDRAPRRGSDHMGPFDTFASYPTRHVGPATLATLAIDLEPDAYKALIEHPILAYWNVTPAAYGIVRGALQAGPASVEALAGATGLPAPAVIEVVARLAKLGILTLS